MTYKKRIHKRTIEFFKDHYGLNRKVVCGKWLIENYNYAFDDISNDGQKVTCQDCLRKMEVKI